jgi:hypothetical protein
MDSQLDLKQILDLALLLCLLVFSRWLPEGQMQHQNIVLLPTLLVSSTGIRTLQTRSDALTTSEL